MHNKLYVEAGVAMRNKRTHGRGEWWKLFPVSSVPPSSVTVALVALMPEAMVT